MLIKTNLLSNDPKNKKSNLLSKSQDEKELS